MGVSRQVNVGFLELLLVPINCLTGLLQRAIEGSLVAGVERGEKLMPLIVASIFSTDAAESLSIAGSRSAAEIASS